MLKNLFASFKKFLKEGWYKFEVVNKPKTFFKYFTHFPLNWGWTLGSVLFIGIFIEGGNRYNSPLLFVCTLFPLIMMIYNLVDEYYAFQYFKFPDYKKPQFDKEIDEKFRGTDYYWDRVHEFEKEHNITPLTERHNGVIGRKVSAKTLQNIAKWSGTAVLAYMAIRVFITG